MAVLLKDVFEFSPSEIVEGLRSGWPHYDFVSLGRTLLNQQMFPNLDMDQMTDALAPEGDWRVNYQAAMANGVLYGDSFVADRDAARWVISNDGRVTTYIDSDGLHWSSIFATEDLPQTPFLLNGAEFTWTRNDPVIDFVSNAERLTHFTHLNATGPEMTGAILNHIATLSTLETLDIGRFAFSGAELSKLFELPKLTRLWILNKSPGEEIIDVVSGFSKLTSLRISDCPVTDRGVRRLRRLSNLTELTLSGTRISSRGRAELQDALPNCRIQLENVSAR